MMKRMMWSCMCVRVVMRRGEERGRRGGGGGGAGGRPRRAGWQPKKLEPHTEMWGTTMEKKQQNKSH